MLRPAFGIFFRYAVFDFFQRKALENDLKAAGLPVVPIEELKAAAERVTGKPKPLARGKRVVGEVEYRDGSVIDRIYSVDE